VDLGLAHRLDPVANPAEGQIVAGWSIAADRREVHVHLTGVHAASDPSTTADVGAVIHADGSGSLAFDADANLLASADALETRQIRSRWTPSGAGRADVEAQGGDAADGTLVTECWDASFGRVYALGPGPDGGVATEGDASACVFTKPLR
jgi:hypothetical protein